MIRKKEKQRTKQTNFTLEDTKRKEINTKLKNSNLKTIKRQTPI